MARMTLPAPDPLNTAGLAEEIELAGLPAVTVAELADEVEIQGNFSLAQADDIIQKVQQHTGQPPVAEREKQDARDTINDVRTITPEVLQKALEVREGSSTFTNAQIQRIAAEVIVYFAAEQRLAE